MSQSKEVRIDPFLHNKEKFTKIEKDFKEKFTKIEKDFKDASKMMQEGIERAKTSRIDVIGQNGNTGEHYDEV